MSMPRHRRRESWKYKDVLDGRWPTEANHENFSRPITEQDPSITPWLSGHVWCVTE